MIVGVQILHHLSIKKTGKNLTNKEIIDICGKCGQSNTSFS
jgi:hypothetical protein